jgi:potassium-transporting ATPase KdpC subunit
MLDEIRTNLKPALILFGLLTLVTGVFYPLLVTGIAQAVFPDKADGSLIRQGELLVGSRLIGQDFSDPAYFSGRPSAAASSAGVAASGGSNLGPSNPALFRAVQERAARLRSTGPGVGSPIPADLLTASGSGLDPHISPAAALFQVPRVARARGISAAKVRELVDQLTEGRQLGVLGEPRVNVLELNLALDRLAGRRPLNSAHFAKSDTIMRSVSGG